MATNLKPEEQKPNRRQKYGYYISTPLVYTAIAFFMAIGVGLIALFAFSTVAEIFGVEEIGVGVGFAVFVVAASLAIFSFIIVNLVVPEADEILVLQNPFGINFPVELEKFYIPEVEDDDPSKVMVYNGPKIVIDGAFMPVTTTVKPPWVTVAAKFKVGPRVLIIKDDFPLKPAPLAGSSSKNLIQRTVNAELSLQYQVVRPLAGTTARRFFSGDCKGYEELEAQVKLHVLNYMRAWFAEKVPGDVQGDAGRTLALDHYKLCYGPADELSPQQIELGIAIGRFKVIGLALTTASEDEAVERRLAEQERSLENAAKDLATRRGKLIEQYKKDGLSDEAIERAVANFEFKPGGTVNVNHVT